MRSPVPLVEELAPMHRDKDYWVTALGLISGWGEVALHGSEGFRCEYAQVLCLFTDHPWTVSTWRPLFNWEHSKRVDLLASVANGLGVPLLSIEGAVNSGVLSEFGISNEVAKTVLELALWRKDR